MNDFYWILNWPTRTQIYSTGYSKSDKFPEIYRGLMNNGVAHFLAICMSLFSRHGPTTHQEIGRIMMCHAQKCLALMSTRVPEKISVFFEFPWFDVLQQKMICHSTGIRNIWDVPLRSLPWPQIFARMLTTDLSIYYNFENELKFECLTFWAMLRQFH